MVTIGITPKKRPYTSIYASLPKIRLSEEAKSSPFWLPSLQEFERGVEKLLEIHGPSTVSPPPTLSPPPRTTAPTQQDVLPGPPLQTPSFYDEHAYSRRMLSPPASHYSSMGLHGYPSPPPDGDNRHINKKYSTEEGDFIIYALHDKKQKWASITRDFARLFGTTPERSTSGLQAWYYRMNLRIPIWNADGFLVFNHEDDEEPKTTAIKCREKDKDQSDRPGLDTLGLAQRYPERLMGYSWADNETKHLAQDWGESCLSPSRRLKQPSSEETCILMRRLQ